MKQKYKQVASDEVIEQRRQLERKRKELNIGKEYYFVIPLAKEKEKEILSERGNLITPDKAWELAVEQAKAQLTREKKARMIGYGIKFS